MSLLLSAPLVLSMFGAAAHGAVVHRCSEPDGSPVFTDRSCASLGMSDRLPPPGSKSPGATHRARVGTHAACASSPNRLRLSLSDALQARDVNGLLGLIDWDGTNGSSARATARRMAGIAKRESLEVTLESEVIDPFDAYGREFGAQEIAPELLARNSPPTAIRVEQRGAAGSLESVRFGLKRDLGCYWLRI